MLSSIGCRWDSPPGPGKWQADVDRLGSEVLPLVEELRLSYYLLAPGPCRILEYPRGDYRDGGPWCKDVVLFDAVAREDWARVSAAIERSGVAVERIYRPDGAVHVRVPDSSIQYNFDRDGGISKTTGPPQTIAQLNQLALSAHTDH